MIIPFDNAGSVGVIQDLPAHELPIGAWSAATNIRFNDGSAAKFLGHSEPFGTPSIAPYWLLAAEGISVDYWMYAGLAAVYVTDGVTSFDVTRASGAYNAAAETNWNGGILGGIPILNNGIDDPQAWTAVDTGTLLVDLPNWPASTECSVMRPFKTYLVALDINASSVRSPYKVKWSHPADPGAVPASWDETDETKDAGETNLAEGGGFIIDGLTLRDSFIIYRESSTYIMRFIGGRFIFEFRELFKSHGVLATNCVQEFDGKHVVLTPNDLIVHDGQSAQSIVDSRMRDTLFNDIDDNNYSRSFISPNYETNEMWICYPESGETFCTKALVWNYRHNTFGFRALPGTMNIAFGIVDSGGSSSTWDSDTDTWDSDTTTWGARLHNPTKKKMLMADTANTKLYKIDDTNQFDGVSLTATLERQGLAVVDGKNVDLNSIKRINRIWPRITATNGTVVNVYAGQQMEIGDTVTYGSAVTYTVGTDYKVDLRTTGRLLAVKFETTGNVAWELDGFDMDIDLVSQR